VRTIVMGIVMGNLLILFIFFLAPRMQFLLAYRDLTSHQLMETAGSSDMPNQRTRTYRVVSRIEELTPEDATVFMPPGDLLEGSFRSAAIQVLYPRKIIFGENENYEAALKGAEKFKVSYFVYSPEWKSDFCEESSRIELTDLGFGMCRIDP
jgi:hypothetical protein